MVPSVAAPAPTPVQHASAARHGAKHLALFSVPNHNEGVPCLLSCLTFLDHNFVLLPGGKGKKKGERGGGKREDEKRGLKPCDASAGV